jgi:hypothetical protein
MLVLTVNGVLTICPTFILDKNYILFYQHKHLIIDSKLCIDSFTYIYINCTSKSYVCLPFINFISKEIISFNEHTTKYGFAGHECCLTLS